MAKGRFTSLTDEEAREAFFSDMDILTASSQLKCTHSTLRKRWVTLFGEEGYNGRKRRLHSAAAKRSKFWEHAPKGEDHPMWGAYGELNHNWKGEDYSYVSEGYRMIRAPAWWEGATTNGWVREHRIVLARSNGWVSLPDGHEVHHKDGNKLNNSPDNLEMLTKAEHSEIHMRDIPRDHMGRMEANGKRLSSTQG